MVKCGILFILMILPIIAFSRQTETVPVSPSTKGVFFDVSLGASVPVGDYAKSDITNEQAGFSRTGVAVQLNCDLMGKRDFGLALQYTFQLNPLAKDSKDLVVSGMSTPLGSGHWTNHYLMLGPEFMKYFGKFLLEAKAIVGVIIATSPLFKTEDPAFTSVSNNTGTGFAFGIGLGAGYLIAPNLALKVNAAYQMGTPKIDRQYGAQIIGYNNKDSVFVYSAPVTYDTKKVVSSFNLGISVIFKIP
jgi:hypothetical protein